MKKVWLLVFTLLSCSKVGFAIYGPSLKRADTSISMLACRDAKFSDDERVVAAVRDAAPLEVLEVLGPVLREFHDTSVASDLYPSRAFCLHELIPSSIAPESGSIGDKPPSTVSLFRSLGIEYFYYEPDRRWTLRQDPVSLGELATAHLNSRWGRQAFLMMTQVGWSEGGCREGADQFRQVIDHGRAFLADYPLSEVSDELRLEMAKAYSTWWNLSVSKVEPRDRGADEYRKGAQEAKSQAISIYSDYLRSHRPPDPHLQLQLMRLRGDPKGSGTYDYYCPDYED